MGEDDGRRLGWGESVSVYAPRSCYPILKSPYVVCSVCVFTLPVSPYSMCPCRAPLCLHGSPEFYRAVGPTVGDVLELKLLESRGC